MYKKFNVKFGNDIARLEFWIVTGCLVLTLLIAVFDTIINNHAQLSYVLMPQLFSYFIVFISYLLLCFYVAPAFESGKKPESNGTLFVFITQQTAARRRHDIHIYKRWL
jgi:two-component system LytT family sensor kinase